jgi:hypothetical protein
LCDAAPGRKANAIAAMAANAINRNLTIMEALCRLWQPHKSAALAVINPKAPGEPGSHWDAGIAGLMNERSSCAIIGKLMVKRLVLFVVNAMLMRVDAPVIAARRSAMLLQTQS